jgi:5,6,7,8-tetrahydromethanopterin hydro-lyase
MEMFVGEALAGSGPNTAHVNVVMGPRSGPVGVAFATAMASPSQGHLPFLAVLQPNVAVKPATLVVNKASLQGEIHQQFTWGPAQASVARAVRECLLEGLFPSEAENEWCVVVSVWVNWVADQADEVFENNYQATRQAITSALALLPTRAELVEVGDHIHNPYYAVRRGRDGS